MPRQDGINNGLESPYSVGNGKYRARAEELRATRSSGPFLKNQARANQLRDGIDDDIAWNRGMLDPPFGQCMKPPLYEFRLNFQFCRTQLRLRSLYARRQHHFHNGRSRFILERLNGPIKFLLVSWW